MLAAVALLSAGATGAGASDFARLSESRFDDLLRLPQWRQVARQLPAEAVLVRACLTGDCRNPAARRLAAFVADGATRDPMAQLRRVNKAVNRQPYRDDRDQFGVEDLWQSPLSFAPRGGDCEDFAIAKYLVLKLLGFSPSDLRIAVLTGTESSEVHAVLLARAEGEWLVLDNRKDEPTAVERYRGWTPQYAVTEVAGFRYSSTHRGATDRLAAPAQR